MTVQSVLSKPRKKGERTMKKQETGIERILGRKLARELRGEELARVNGTLDGDGGPQPVQPINTTTLIQPPDTIVDGWVA
jgi:hypothetical protein